MYPLKTKSLKKVHLEKLQERSKGHPYTLLFDQDHDKTFNLLIVSPRNVWILRQRRISLIFEKKI